MKVGIYSYLGWCKKREKINHSMQNKASDNKRLYTGEMDSKKCRENYNNDDYDHLVAPRHPHLVNVHSFSKVFFFGKKIPNDFFFHFLFMPLVVVKSEV